MQRQTPSPMASALVLCSGVFWGFYWVPVRALSDMGLPGAWGTLAITIAAALGLGPFAARHMGDLRRSSALTLAATALGGVAFALYSTGLVYGRVAIITLLFFLTPVWSTLLSRYVLGQPTARLRVLAFVVGLIGLGIMLGADGQWPIPRNAGEWMALGSGIAWALGSTGMTHSPPLRPVLAAWVFVLAAAVTALIVALALAPAPQITLTPAMLSLAIGTGVIWWGLSVALLLWATVRLDPGRTGILLMSEVIVGIGSAALFAGEHLSRLELAGGALVVCAAVLEVWPMRRASPIVATKPEDQP